MYINSPGGSVYAGLGMYDTMQFVAPDISTICTGMAASMAAVLMCAGAKGKRTALKHSRIMLHQPFGSIGGQATDIEITAKESIHPIIETTVVNNRLIIRYKNGKTYDADESIHITVSGHAVNRFELNSSGSIYSMDPIHHPSVVIRSNGSGNIQLLHVATDNIDAESNVSGRIVVSGGETIQGKLKTDASGKIDISAVAARRINARIIGSGDIKVKVSDQLDARIDGSGSIYFTGFPFVISDISGSGKLIHL